MGPNWFAADIQSESGGFYKDIKESTFQTLRFDKLINHFAPKHENSSLYYPQSLWLFQIVDLHEPQDPQCSLGQGGDLMKVLAWGF